MKKPSSRLFFSGWVQFPFVLAIAALALYLLPKAASSVTNTVGTVIVTNDNTLPASSKPTSSIVEVSSEPEESSGFFGDWSEFSDFFEESGTISVGRPSSSSAPDESSEEDENGEENSEASSEESGETSDPSETAEPVSEIPSAPGGEGTVISTPSGGAGPGQQEGEPSVEPSEISSEPLSEPSEPPVSSEPSSEPSSVPAAPVGPDAPVIDG